MGISLDEHRCLVGPFMEDYDNGKAIITAKFDGPGAKIVLFGVE
jgi:hypothetical protein